jgi:hypothetical protein
MAQMGRLIMPPANGRLKRALPFAQGGPLYYLLPISLRAAQILWGSLASCSPVVNRREWRVANPPQAASLPHMFGCGFAALCDWL